jgi:site-specific DNA-methyltransferase (adenine-specific)
MIDLRLGRYQDALADVACDALITDAPYSDKTHSGHDSATASVNEYGESERETLTYDAWTPDDVRECVQFWHPRTRGWFVTITDSELVSVWREELAAVDRYVFSPLSFVHPGSRVRIQGDGPAQWSVNVVVARPRTLSFAKWGALPGAYVMPKQQDNRRGDKLDVIGGKPLWLMQSLVRDYSRPGDLVCDPCAGGGTTLLAAAIEGRRAVGAEAMPEHFERAHKRFARGYTPTLFG